MDMKINETLCLVAASFAMFAAASCDKNRQGPELPPDGEPSVTLNEERLDVSQKGGAFTVGYELVEADGAVVTPSCTAEWVSNLSALDDAISFSVSPNDSEQARETGIVVRYGDSSDTLALVQAAIEHKGPFDIVVKNVLDDKVTVDIIPEDKELSYMSMCVSTQYYDIYDTDDEFFVSTLINLREFLEFKSDITFDEFIQDAVTKGDLHDVVFDGLVHGTRYMVYAAGISEEDYYMIGDMSRVEFEPAPVEMTDVTFDISIEGDAPAVITVVPSDTGQMYYSAMYSRKDIEEAGISDIDFFRYNVSQLLQYGLGFGWMSQYFMEQTFSRGETEYEYDYCDKGREYVAFAVALNNGGDFCSEVFAEEMTASPVEPSDNIVEITVKDISPWEATWETAVTNDDEYIVKTVRSSAIAGKPDEEIIAILLMEESKEIHWWDSYGYLYRLDPDTEYTVLALGYDSGFATTPLFREDFRTKEYVPCGIDVSIQYDKYYDVDELAKIYSSFMEYLYQDLAYIKLTVETSGDEPQYTYMSIFTENPENMKITDLIYKLKYESDREQSKRYFVKFDRDVYLTAAAADKDGNFSEVYVKKVRLTRDGATPADEYE